MIYRIQKTLSKRWCGYVEANSPEEASKKWNDVDNWEEDDGGECNLDLIQIAEPLLDEGQEEPTFETAEDYDYDIVFETEPNYTL